MLLMVFILIAVFITGLVLSFRAYDNWRFGRLERSRYVAAPVEDTTGFLTNLMIFNEVTSSRLAEDRRSLEDDRRSLEADRRALDAPQPIPLVSDENYSRDTYHRDTYSSDSYSSSDCSSSDSSSSDSGGCGSSD